MINDRYALAAVGYEDHSFAQYPHLIPEMTEIASVVINEKVMMNQGIAALMMTLILELSFK